MKKNIVILIIIAILIGLGGYFLFQNVYKRSMVDSDNIIDWDNTEEIFNIDIPSDFDDTKMERLEEKIATAKQALDTDRENTWTWIVVGNMYEFVQDYDRAIAAYEQALSLQEMEVISLSNLAYIYEKYKPDFDKAEYYYKRLLESNPNIPVNYLNFAQFYDFRINDKQKAEQTYLDGLDNTENNPDVLVAIIRFYERENRLDEAKKYANLLLELYPDEPQYEVDFGYLINN